jgi:hypothetical protein
MLGSAGAIVAIAVVLATPAFGVQGRLANLFGNGGPAPAHVVKEFAGMDVGAPAGMAPGVIAGETREVMAVPLSTGNSAVLWVAPTQSGGFCELVSASGRRAGGGGGCDRDRLGRFAPGEMIPGPISADGTILKAPVLIYGHALDPRASEVEIHSEDGTVATTKVVWVSAPINAGFFIYEVPKENWQAGHRPSKLVLTDASGHQIAEEKSYIDNMVGAMSRADPRTGTPALALAAQRRQLIAITTEKGTREVLWLAPRRGGGQCNWLTSDGHPGRSSGCPPPTTPSLRPNEVAAGLLGGGAPILFEGQVGAAVAKVELHFQDGEVDRLQPVNGFVLTEIRSQHWARGHRLDQITGMDRSGGEISRQAFDPTAVGTYPCDKPVDIGRGVKACP